MRSTIQLVLDCKKSIYIQYAISNRGWGRVLRVNSYFFFPSGELSLRWWIIIVDGGSPQVGLYCAVVNLYIYPVTLNWAVSL